MSAPQLETRTLKLFGDDESLELRIASDEQPRRLVGYAATFNSLSKDLGGFKERLVPGAFKDSIGSGEDIRALVGHDPALLLGRTSNGTLRIAEDDLGLRVEIDLPQTSYANDVLELVRRRDVRGMSFGFRVREGGQRIVREGGQVIRELRNLILREVSTTPTPAYNETSLQLRIDPDVLRQAPRPKFARCDNIMRTALLKG